MRRPVRRVGHPVPSARHRHHAAEEGFTLVELLVVGTLLLAVIGVGMDAMINYIVDVRRHQERVDALHSLQLSAATVSRELRAADPLDSYTAVACDASRFPAHTAPVLSCANDLTVRVLRRGKTLRLRYVLVPDGSGARLDLTRSELVSGVWGPATTSTVLRGLSNGAAPAVPVFALADLSGAPVTAAPAVARLSLSLLRRVEVPGRPQVRLDAQVAVRNTIYRRARS